MMYVLCYLDSFSVDDCGIHFEDGGFDGSRRWQFGHTDVDWVWPFRIEHNQLFGLGRFLLFLQSLNNNNKEEEDLD